MHQTESRTKELVTRMLLHPEWEPGWFAGLPPGALAEAGAGWARGARIADPSLTGRELEEALSGLAADLPRMQRMLLRWAVVVRAGLGRFRRQAKARWALGPAYSTFRLDAPAVAPGQARWAALHVARPSAPVAGQQHGIWLRIYAVQAGEDGRLAVTADGNLILKNVWKRPELPDESRTPGAGWALSLDRPPTVETALELAGALRDAEEALCLRSELGEIAAACTGGDIARLVDDPARAGQAELRCRRILDSLATLQDSFQESEPVLPEPVIGWPEATVPADLRQFVRQLSGTVLHAVPLQAAKVVEAPLAGGVVMFDYGQVIRSTCRVYHGEKPVYQWRPAPDGGYEVTYPAVRGTATAVVAGSELKWRARTQILRARGPVLRPADFRIGAADFGAVAQKFARE